MTDTKHHTIALHIADVSAFARSIVQALKARQPLKPEPPGQVELLNLIARTQGHRNWQSLRQAPPPAALPQADAGALSPSAVASPTPGAATSPAAALSDNARKALGQFDAQGRLLRWPVKFSVQKLVMWWLWTHFDAKRIYTEREVNAILKATIIGSDHVTLRRELINHRLMARKSDCREYRKLPARPDGETRALLAACRARFRPGRTDPA